MSTIALELDPTSEDATNTPLVLVVAGSQFLTEESYPEPPESPTWASSSDTEGATLVANRHENRTGQRIVLDIYGSSAANLESRLLAISQKVQKIRREGGTLKRTSPAGSVGVLDLLAGGMDFAVTHALVERNVATVTLTFTAKPYWRGPEEDLGDNVETTNPCLVFTDTGVKGDVPALGRLVIDEDQGQDQWFVMWGLQSRYYSSASTAALFYEAESLTPLGTAATSTALNSTASGAAASKTVLAGDLTTTYQAILSTQASGGGSHFSHIGDFRVWARVQTPAANSGTVSVALEWGEGDFRKFTRNTPVALSTSYEGSWRLVDLGLVHPTKVTQGAQRWEGRVVASSTTAGDDLHVDCLFIVPVTEGYGEVRATSPTDAPTAMASRDEFDQPAGALNAKTPPVGTLWATTGGTPDFQVNGTGLVSRAGPVTNRRLATLGSAMTNQVAQADVMYDAAAAFTYAGVLLRYVDSSNYLAVGMYRVNMSSPATVIVETDTTALGGGLVIAEWPFPANVAASTWYRIRGSVDAAGRLNVWAGIAGNAGLNLVGQLQTSLLATGGTLASGKAGIFDSGSGALAVNRYFDNFVSYVPPADAAMFASQSLEVRGDRATRENSSGTIWTTPSSYRGDYLLIPPAGNEGRTNRIMVKTSRNLPTVMPDSGIDDLSARLYYTPRYLSVPA